MSIFVLMSDVNVRLSCLLFPVGTNGGHERFLEFIVLVVFT